MIKERIEQEIIYKSTPHHAIPIFNIGDKVKVYEEFCGNKTFKNKDRHYIIEKISNSFIKLKGNAYSYPERIFYKE
jgi:hypothetical protein